MSLTDFTPLSAAFCTNNVLESRSGLKTYRLLGQPSEHWLHVGVRFCFNGKGFFSQLSTPSCPICHLRSGIVFMRHADLKDSVFPL